MSGKARVAGVGTVPFSTPIRSQTYDVMGEAAAKPALADAAVVTPYETVA